MGALELYTDDEWVEVLDSALDIGEVSFYEAIVNNLKLQAASLQNEIPAAASAIAPKSATTPTLRHSGLSGTNYAQQGGCTDGEHIYFYIRASNESNAGTFVKMRRSDYSVVSKKSLSLYHGNDMCYNPDTGYIYVATTYESESGNTSRIDVIDPSTLTRVAQKYAPSYISAIAYEPTRKVFVGASGSNLSKNIYRLDENGEFKLMRAITVTESPSYSADRDSQSITCDSGFIYHLWSAAPKLYIEVCDWLGNYICTISKSVSHNSNSLEAEWIDKTSKNGFIMGMYAAGKGSNSPAYIYSFTTS